MRSIKGIKAVIGESPIWQQSSSSLFWVEAAGSDIFQYHTVQDTTTRYSVPFDITAIALCENNHWVCASKQGLFYSDPDFQTFNKITDPCSDTPCLHLNDAVTSPQGELWFGSMNCEQLHAPDGKLFLLRQGATAEMDSGFSVANGIAFNPQLKRVYCSNMFQRVVYEYQLNDQMNQIISKTVFVALGEDEGYPDGLTVDQSGNLYICHWDKGIISYYSPSTRIPGEGNKLGEIELPVRHATRCTFGGEDFNTLFITTASYELTAEEELQLPQSGQLFVIKSPTQGRAEYKIKLSSLAIEDNKEIAVAN